MSTNEGKSFWSTLPGVLTAIAALITAIGGLIAIFATLPRPNPFFPATEPPAATEPIIIATSPPLTPKSVTLVPPLTATNTPTPLDLHASAVSAEWVSSAGELPFGGPDAANGFASHADRARLEDGTFPSKILVMHPHWVTDGEISGVYLPYLVAHRGHFHAQLGFLAMPDGTCGVGDVIFRLSYKEPGSSERPLGEWTETCDGMLRNIDIDLNSLEGKTVQVILAVLAHGSYVHDWAVWVNPHIE